MTNNDILRSLRYTFDLEDSEMIKIFSLAEKSVLREEVCSWLKKEDKEGFISCNDEDFLTYLDGFIIYKRGKKEGEPVKKIEQKLTHNLILKKIKIALNLKSDEFMAILGLVNIKISKHELSALFRQETHKNYRECKDQFLRNFLKGLQKKFRPGS